MGIKPYKERVTAINGWAAAMETPRLLTALLQEQRRTNELLAELLASQRPRL